MKERQIVEALKNGSPLSVEEVFAAVANMQSYPRSSVARAAFERAREESEPQQKAFVAEIGVAAVFRGEPSLYSDRGEPKDDFAKEHHHYAYIPYHIETFVERLCNEAFSEVRNFIDVGHGIGDKPLIAAEVFGWQATGVEYTPQSYWAGRLHTDMYYGNISGRRRVQGCKPNYLLGDAFDLEYGEYDLVYLYCPMSNPSRMRQLYNLIWDGMHLGAMLMEVYPQDGFYKFVHEDLGVPPVNCRPCYRRPVLLKNKQVDILINT